MSEGTLRQVGQWEREKHHTKSQQPLGMAATPMPASKPGITTVPVTEGHLSRCGNAGLGHVTGHSTLGRQTACGGWAPKETRLLDPQAGPVLTLE